MIRAIIVEDEKPALDRINGFIKSIPDLVVIASTNSGHTAAELIDDEKPDLVFLDIHLTDISGIDLIHLITHKPLIIFTTAYNQYAIQAFEIQAVDYLLKPFSKQRLEIAVDRAREKISKGLNSDESLRQLLSQWSPKKDYLKRIPSKIGDKIYIINDDDIVYFAAEQKLVFAYLAKTKYLVNYKLEELTVQCSI